MPPWSAVQSFLSSLHVPWLQPKTPPKPLARVTEPPDEPNSDGLLIVLRGGLGHKSQHGASSEAHAPVNSEENKRLFRSVRRYIVRPSQALGWHVQAACDAVDPTHTGSMHWATVRTMSELLGLEEAAVAVRVRYTPDRSQADSYLAAISWITWVTKQKARSCLFLFLRNDMIFKHALPMAAPAHTPTRTALVSFGTWFQREHANRNPADMRISDTLFVLPRAVLPTFRFWLSQTVLRQTSTAPSLLTRSRCAWSRVPKNHEPKLKFHRHCSFLAMIK